MSITKAPLAREDIERLARSAFGSDVQVASVRSADSGMFNAGYHIELGGRRAKRVFLKVAPPSGTPVLLYERDMMRAEVGVLDTLARAGVGRAPKVLKADFTSTIIERDYFFMEEIDGELLLTRRTAIPSNELLDIRRQIAAIAGTSTNISNGFFGYPGVPALQGRTWPDAFERMTLALLDDADRFETVLPMSSHDIAQRFRAGAAGLDENTIPRLVHFDLWDGNVLVGKDQGAWNVRGIIDWERAFFGDPLAELVSLTLIEDAGERNAVTKAFLAHHDVSPDARMERRLALYRAYLWLIMIVEAKPRGFGGSILLNDSSAARRFRRDMAIAAGE